MFKEKGIILKSHLTGNIKVAIAIFQDNETGDLVPLVKCFALRKKKVLKQYRFNNIYKAWLNLNEVYALIASLQRASVLVEEYHEGTLDLKDILTEDMDIRHQVSTENTMSPTIEDMFNLSKEGNDEPEDEFDEDMSKP